MSVRINDLSAVVRGANTLPDKEEQDRLAYEADVKKLGSRVTSRQGKIIGEVITAGQMNKLVGSDDLVQSLRRYADTGDKAQLTPEQNEALTAVVKAGRERALQETDGVKGESQARRIWPRKVSAIVLNINDASRRTPPAPAPAEETEGEQPAVAATA